MMVRGYKTYKDFLGAGEGIASNILSDRLRKLQAAGIVQTEPSESDKRRLHYRLTEKGIGLAPVLLELLVWGVRHEPTGASRELIENMAANRAAVLAETRRRWEEKDPEPLLPHLARQTNSKEKSQDG